MSWETRTQLPADSGIGPRLPIHGYLGSWSSLGAWLSQWPGAEAVEWKARGPGIADLGQAAQHASWLGRNIIFSVTGCPKATLGPTVSKINVSETKSVNHY